MKSATFRDDSPSVKVKGNDIDSALKLLRRQTVCVSAFGQIRMPRKNMKHRQRRRDKRLMAAEDKK